MFQKPDYASLRQQKGFSWHAAASQDALRTVTGIPIRDFNLNPDACIEAYSKGCPKFREMFGPDAALPALSTPHISYGHANGLGAELVFPEGGEVGHTHPCGSLDQGVRALRAAVDFSAAGMAPFYLSFKEKMEKAFPGETVGFGYGLEGPVTTAWEMRGEGFFTDIFDDPAGAAEYLGLITESILAFHRFLCKVRRTPEIDPVAGGMADDIAAMIPPQAWEELVLPFWDRYFNGLTSGERNAHVEDLRPSQVSLMEKAGLSYWDPSVSPKLTPEVIFKSCRVPFGWRLPGFSYAALSEQGVRDFVFSAARDGAGTVFTIVEGVMCGPETVRKVRAFISAAREAKAMIDQGVPRKALPATAL